jgi:hypothetical protein
MSQPVELDLRSVKSAKRYVGDGDMLLEFENSYDVASSLTGEKYKQSSTIRLRFDRDSAVVFAAPLTTFIADLPLNAPTTPTTDRA